jgi:short-subunit dehydrogenase
MSEAPALRPVALITGASAGIGTALAHVFAENGHELVLVARRAQRLAELADTIAASGRARPHVAAIDLTRTDAAAQIAIELARRGLEPQYVVNNAGFGLYGDAAELPLAEQLAMIDLNVRALAELSLAFINSLARRRGGILNVASVASYLPGPGMAVYYASKAFALSFGEALHEELSDRGIRVTTLCPGPVATEFQARAGIRRSLDRRSRLVQSPQAVATAGYAALMRGQRVVVPGLANHAVTVITRLMPRGLLAKAVARVQRSWAKPATGS